MYDFSNVESYTTNWVGSMYVFPNDSSSLENTMTKFSQFIFFIIQN
jgi:hypothetical protein